MEKEQAKERIICLIKEGDKSYHKHYKKTVELTELYTKLMTGEGMETLLRRFTKRESEEAFEQRKQITQHITSSVCKNLTDTFYKVPRSNSLKRVVTYKGEKPTDNKKILQEKLDVFWGNQDINSFFGTRFIELNSIDPNAFICIEFKDFDSTKERATPYPFEVFSKDAIDYKYENNILQYLIVKTEISKTIKSGGNAIVKTGYRYTAYLKNESIVFEEILERDNNGNSIDFKQEPQKPKPLNLLRNILLPNKNQDEEIDKSNEILINSKFYRIIEPTPHNANCVPAFRVGYVRDLSTNGETSINIFHCAIPYLMKSIKANSELDLTMALVAFPLSLRYSTACGAKGCLNGRLADESVCGACKGTGTERPTTVQDEITIALPNDPDDMLNLEDLLVFKRPPVDILNFQVEYIEKLTHQCKITIFNSDIFTRKQIAETATAKNIDLENVNDTLFPLATRLAYCWEFTIKLIANFIDLDKDLIVKLTFGKDFKLKSLDDLIGDLERANKANCPALVNQIKNDIARILHAENPNDLIKYETHARFNPFTGKGQNEILVILSSNLTPLRLKVLYSNLDSIFLELEAESATKGGNFYELEYSEQNEKINNKVKEYIDEINKGEEILIIE